MSEYVVVFMTASSLDEAETIAHTLVEERLAACVNIVPSITSVYRWEGATHHDQETLLIAKTRRSAFSRLAQRVKEVHSYETPEVIAVRVEDGLPAYLSWIAQEVPQ
jgi:periplasmic divalent cation tolerance protein